jgi:hypothetical protein
MYLKDSLTVPVCGDYMEQKNSKYEGNVLCMRGISFILAQMHKIPEYYFLFMWIWPLHEPDINLLAFFVFYHIVIVTFTKLKFCP